MVNKSFRWIGRKVGISPINMADFMGFGILVINELDNLNRTARVQRGPAFSFVMTFSRRHRLWRQP